MSSPSLVTCRECEGKGMIGGFYLQGCLMGAGICKRCGGTGAIEITENDEEAE